MLAYLLIFITGGLVSLVASYAELSGHHLLSEFAALFPTVTVVLYLFLGNLANDQAVARHAYFVLLGTLIAWVPYMLIIYHCAPKMGTTKAMALGLTTLVLLSTVFIKVFHH